MAIRYLIYFVLVLLGIKWNSFAIYILFLVMCVDTFSKRIELKEKMLIISIYSIILPDNYFAEVFFLIYFVLNCIRKKKIKIGAYSLAIALLLVSALISTVLSFVSILNVIFAIFSFAPFLGVLMLLNSKDSIQQEYTKYIDRVLCVEIFATVLNFIFFFNTAAEDWSCGTFGRSGGQQAQLFVIGSFFAIHYFYLFYNDKYAKSSLAKMIASISVAWSTNCWTLLLSFIVGLGIYFLTTLSRKKIIVILLVIGTLPIIYSFSLRLIPNNVSAVFQRMVDDSSYFDYRFHKATVYKETFVDIPKEDIKFAFLGTGVGAYNSRAALICTGEYIDFYNKLFKSSMSKYTKEYIYNYVKLAHDYGGSDFGSVLARPYSSVMALMGECGYIGVIFWGIAFLLLVKQNDIIARSILFVWLSFCLVENYFEYPKVLVSLYICILSVRACISGDYIY